MPVSPLNTGPNPRPANTTVGGATASGSRGSQTPSADEVGNGIQTICNDSTLTAQQALDMFTQFQRKISDVTQASFKQAANRLEDGLHTDAQINTSLAAVTSDIMSAMQNTFAGLGIANLGLPDTLQDTAAFETQAASAREIALHRQAGIREDHAKYLKMAGMDLENRVASADLPHEMTTMEQRLEVETSIRAYAKQIESEALNDLPDREGWNLRRAESIGPHLNHTTGKLLAERTGPTGNTGTDTLMRTLESIIAQHMPAPSTLPLSSPDTSRLMADIAVDLSKSIKGTSTSNTPDSNAVLELATPCIVERLLALRQVVRSQRYDALQRADMKHQIAGVVTRVTGVDITTNAPRLITPRHA